MNKMKKSKKSKVISAYIGDQSKIKHWNRDIFFTNGCPDCGSNDFLEGPHGGLSINFKCAKCNSEFNDTWVFGIDRIIKIGKRN
jgi:transposase-like protein